MSYESKPWMGIQQSRDDELAIGPVALIGPDDAEVATGEYSKSVEIPLVNPTGGEVSGEIIKALLISSGGAIIAPTGRLLLFSSDPGMETPGVSVLPSLALLDDLVMDEVIDASEWGTDSLAARLAKPVMHSFVAPLGKLWAVWHHQFATPFNSAGGDDEQLQLKLEYRREG